MNSPSKHWSEHKEEAGTLQIDVLFFLYRLLPPFFLSVLAYPVGFFYFLLSKKGREESRRFLDQFAVFSKIKRPSVLRHITAFALTVVEKAAAWGGKISFKRIHFQDDDIVSLIADLEQGKGTAILCSHLGNTELLRALADYNRTGVSRTIPVTSVVDFEVTPFFNNMLNRLNPQSSLKVINANAIQPDSIITLKEETDRGGLAVIAGDRTSAHTRDKIFTIPFLGKEACFPQGPYLVAALLEVPVYAIFALRHGDLSPFPNYDMYVHLLRPENNGGFSRKERKNVMENWARQFAALLENHCSQHPCQWYNFYDFWAVPETAETGVMRGSNQRRG